MNTLRKILGIAWMIIGPLAIYWLISTAANEINRKPELDTKIQWIVFIIIFLPIAVGLSIFGYYAWNGEYDRES